MLPMMIDDPDFESSVHLIKRITTKVLACSGEELLQLAEKKYGEERSKTISMSDADIYLRNSGLTRKMLVKLKKFTDLEQLNLNLSGGVRCDYEDLAQLLDTLLKLKNLELHLESDLTLDRSRVFNLEDVKPYHVMTEPPKDPKKYLNQEIRYPLKRYTNITTLSLSGGYIPDTFLSHFPNLKYLTIDNSLSDISADQHLANKTLRLLKSLACPENLISLQIPSSIPLFSVDKNGLGAIDFRVNPLSQLVKMTYLENITITCPKDRWKEIEIIQSESPFISYPKHEDYLFPHVHTLTIYYGLYHTYHPGTLSQISQSFPNLINLVLIKENTEQAVASIEDPLNKDKLIDELHEIFKKNLWKTINIRIEGIHFSQDIKALFPVSELTENIMIISKSSRKKQQTEDLKDEKRLNQPTRSIFSNISDSSPTTTDEKGESSKLKNSK